MSTRLDNEPRYLKVKNELEALILSGKIDPNRPIPGEITLARKFGVSRGTVRKALEQLKYEGLIVRAPGLGTFPMNSALRPKLASLRSFTEELESLGYAAGAKLLKADVVPMPEETASALECDLGELALVIDRIRTANSVPVAFTRTYLLYRKCAALERTDLGSVSLYKLMKETLREEISQGVQTIRAVALPEAIARHLDAEAGSPSLFIERVGAFADGTKVEHTVAWFRGDLYAYEVELKRYFG